MTKGACRLLAAMSLCVCVPATAEIKLLAEGEISATALDQSHLSGLLEDGETPKAQEGGFGGAIAYSGHEHLYYAVPDRGPGAGETSYIERLYALDIRLNKTDKGFQLVPRISATHLLKDQSGRFMTGDASAFDNVNSESSRRRDSERRACHVHPAPPCSLPMNMAPLLKSSTLPLASSCGMCRFPTSFISIFPPNTSGKS